MGEGMGRWGFEDGTRPGLHEGLNKSHEFDEFDDDIPEDLAYNRIHLLALNFNGETIKADAHLGFVVPRAALASI
jgi:hypothetical protein